MTRLETLQARRAAAPRGLAYALCAAQAASVVASLSLPTLPCVKGRGAWPAKPTHLRRFTAAASKLWNAKWDRIILGRIAREAFRKDRQRERDARSFGLPFAGAV